MNSNRKAFFVIFTLLALFSAPPVAFAGDEWTAVRSKNFWLVGDASDEQMRGVATKLEQFRDVFSRLFSRMNFISPIPTTVVVFKDEKSFAPFKPTGEDGRPKDWVKGFFLPGKDVNYIALSIEDERAGNLGTIFHEYVHFLIDNTLGRTNIPPWFNEGLAEYYEQFRIEDGRRARLGQTNESHLRLLRKNGLVPLERFFAVDYYTLNRQSKENVIAFYAQAWLLTHYLIHGKKGARNDQLYQFSDLRIKGKPAREAFQSAFQTDHATMEKELKKYIEQRTFQTSSTAFEKGSISEAEMRSSAVAPAEAKAYQGDLLNHFNRLAEAEIFLQESLALDSDLSFANTSFGLIKMKEKNFAEAKKYLQKALRADAQNYLAHYSYAFILSREGMTDFGFVAGYTADEAERIRASLRRAIALNPHFAESYNVFAFLSAVRNEDLDEGLQMIGKALEIAPGNQWYLLRAAELYMRQKDFARARSIAQKISQTAPDDQLKLYAQSTLAQINAWEAQLEEIKNARDRVPSEAVTDKILTEEEIARLNEKAMLESLNQALRKPKIGEQRILGFLTEVDCSPEQVIYSFRIGEHFLQLRSDSLDEVFLTTFTADAADSQFVCGVLKRERFAAITYRAGESGAAKVAGQIVAIEFVPLSFKFLEQNRMK